MLKPHLFCKYSKAIWYNVFRTRCRTHCCRPRSSNSRVPVVVLYDSHMQSVIHRNKYIYVCNKLNKDCVGAVVESIQGVIACDIHRICYTVLSILRRKSCIKHIQSKLCCLITQNHMIYYMTKMLAVGHTPLNTPDPI